ncbi:hypothetical protein GCM10011497_14710 [Elstera cyanobacteriorum]|nr:pilus assembly protein N-terminal domain-containing protein [Elstera cyanobacteriorum]GFZ86571.1 hypothetical protein GCM10011497_14710 [Elstera cyanobacteriorum]
MRLLLCALLTFCTFAAAAAADRDYVLPLGQGRVITLPRDARDVFVGSPDVAEIVANTPRVYYISGAKIGATNAIFIDSAGNQVADIAIRVEADVAGLKTALRQALPDADINVQAAGDKLFLTGNVLSASAASMAERLAKLYVKDEKGLVNLLKVAGGDQILLRVRVAEMRRSVAKQLGIKSLAVEGGNIRLSGGRPANGSFGELSFSINSSAFDALEDEGLVRTLAEPNLTAISGEAANFLAGGEFPVPISRDLQGNSIVEFKPFGVGLNFTPVVISSGRISLKMATEVSSLSEEGAQTVGQLRIPGLSVRRVETMVEMASGSSLIVAGLLRNDAAGNGKVTAVLGASGGAGASTVALELAYARRRMQQPAPLLMDLDWTFGSQDLLTDVPARDTIKPYLLETPELDPALLAKLLHSAQGLRIFAGGAEPEDHRTAAGAGRGAPTIDGGALSGIRHYP